MSTRCGPPLWEKWALFRYGVVASLLTSPLPAGELQAALAALAAKAYVHPFKAGQTIRFSKASIERWYYQARKATDPIAALGRKVRSDAGSERVMSAELWHTDGHEGSLKVVDSRGERGPAGTGSRPQDKVRNAEGWRRPVAPPPLPEAPVLPREPVPPLMRQILSLAEADGLPPAYLPKDEALLEEGCDETTA